MDGMDMLEKMEVIDLEHVEEAGESFNTKKTTRKVKIKWWNYTGVAASIAMVIFSGYLFVIRETVKGGTAIEDPGLVASAISENGDLPLVVMVLSLTSLGFFLFLIVRSFMHGR